jgi:hypothetical protein
VAPFIARLLSAREEFGAHAATAGQVRWLGCCTRNEGWTEGSAVDHRCMLNEIRFNLNHYCSRPGKVRPHSARSFGRVAWHGPRSSTLAVSRTYSLNCTWSLECGRTEIGSSSEGFSPVSYRLGSAGNRLTVWARKGSIVGP